MSTIKASVRTSNWISLLRAFIYSLSIVSFLIFRLGQYDFLLPVLSALSVIAIIISVPAAGLPAKIFALLFVGIGTWLLLQKGIGLYDYLLTFGDMLYLLALFAMLPLLALPITIGRYDRAIELLMDRKEKTPFQFYRIITSISFLLSSFLNLATVPIMYHSVKASAKKIVNSNTDKFIALGIIQGFTISVTWTPLSGVVGVVLEITRVNWQKIVHVLFLLSVSALLLNWLIYLALGYLSKNKISKSGQNEIQPDLVNTAAEQIYAGQSRDHIVKPLHKILQIVGVIMLLIALVVSLNHYLKTGIVVTATVIAAPFALIWALLLKKTGAFAKASRSYVLNNIPGMAEQFAIFLSAGFFVNALRLSGYNHAINEYFLSFNHLVGEPVFLIVLPLITMSFSFIGLHPIAVITLLAESLNPIVLGLTPEQLTIALIGGAVMTFMVGPFSGTMGVVSSIIKVNPFEIASWSIVQTVGFFTLLVVFLLFN